MEAVTTVVQSSSSVAPFLLCSVYSSCAVLLVLGCATGFFGVSLQSNRENEFYSKLADLHLEKYNFPVEMIICLPNGTVVRSLPLQLGLALPIGMCSPRGHLQTLKRVSAAPTIP